VPFQNGSEKDGFWTGSKSLKAFQNGDIYQGLSFAPIGVAIGATGYCLLAVMAYAGFIASFRVAIQIQLDTTGSCVCLPRAGAVVKEYEP
jgi:hypothetical protein